MNKKCDSKTSFFMKASDDKVLHELTFTCCRPLNHLGPHISWPDENFSFPSVVWTEKEASK